MDCSNLRIVTDFGKNKKFYGDILGYEYKEELNENNENILLLKYEKECILFTLRSSIKDIRNSIKDVGILPMQIEVEDLKLEKDKLENNNINIISWIPNQELLFLDCNEFQIKYIQSAIPIILEGLIENIQEKELSDKDKLINEIQTGDDFPQLK